MILFGVPGWLQASPTSKDCPPICNFSTICFNAVTSSRIMHPRKILSKYPYP
ncbi:hypothetical protein NC651_026711 [Populus alba x Populus x berolinensis]|nr:hypothetical protein NC651_026711 [Populus alba x Populus x berolinensis]